jgi:peptide deformylase
MAIRPILLYPDPGLLRPTRPVSEVDDRVRRLVEDMVATMHAAPGIGLAANQVGETDRVCVVDLTAGEDESQLLVLINPEIQHAEGSEIDEEGCLSFPGITLDVQRPSRIRVRALNLDAEPFELEADGLFGRCIQHECEHLDGHTFLRNLSSLKREMVKRRIRKRIKAGEWESSPAT